MTIHRFWKIDGDDEMIIDVLVSGNDKHDKIIDEALDAYSAHTGTVRVARREDLIWLKEQRNSSIDRADIEALRKDDEQNDR